MVPPSRRSTHSAHDAPAPTGRQHRHLPAFILLSIAHGPTHGGAIHTALCQRLPGYKSDSAAIYRTLQSLENAGDIEAQWDTSQPGPARKVYRITDAGWEKLEVFKSDIEWRLGLLQAFLDAYKPLASKRR